ncbi:MAG: response regulator transcription factor [Deltaproteobacteria bacterium]|nr:response regulator transcription factor [Deltaproteobacteria bacterium]
MTDHSPVQRVVLVEDDERTRLRLAKAIAKNQRFQVEIAAADFHSGKGALAKFQPDLLVTDLGLPDGSGLDLIRIATADLPACHIMVITVFGDEKNVIAALEAGADGYLLKDATSIEIADSLDELVAGGSPMSAPIARHLLKRFRAESSSTTEAIPPGTDVALSVREIEVLGFVAKGFSFPEIAELLGVSKHTVRTHVRRMYQKLEVSSKGAAVYEAVNLGIISMD